MTALEAQLPQTQFASREGVRTRTISWTDPARSRFRGRGLTGYERLVGIQRGELDPPPAAMLLGMQLDRVERGRTVFSLVADEVHENPMGTMHGGILAALVDTAMGCAVTSLLPVDAGFTTLELKTNYVRAITQATGRIYADGTVVHSGGRVATTEARVHDESGTLYARRDLDVHDPARFEMTDTTATMRVGERALTVREITQDDVERLGRMFSRLSSDTVYRRFFSPIQQPPRSALLWLTSVDHGRREALVALDGDEIVAVARYDGTPGSATAEIAVTVEDEWQHQGVGRRLTRRLAKRALDQGIESFVATVQPDNRAALGLLRKLAPDASVRFAGGEYAASVALPHAR